ncbi:MAG: DUF4293 domain-containing protein [Bacteroidetes bacterium]|nr:DUF4293 domain-containing protein [Bacteroidota bacterium]
MIQRIQTLWLLIATACGFCTFKFPFYSGNIIENSQKVFSELNGKTTIPLIILTVAIAIASFICVFLFKDRKMQLRITLVTFIVSLGLIFLYFSIIKSKYIDGNLTITSMFTFFMPIFLFFAARGIYLDQKLVKSVDRLR